jgi:hypothetical protein
VDGSSPTSTGGAYGASPVRIPDGITPIVAYRLWRVDADGRLGSVAASATWPVGEWVEASCLIPRSGSHRAPSSGCSCGLYAVKTRRQLSNLLAEVASDRPSPIRRGLVVCGVVELSGMIIEHDRGYRAERARIVELLPIRGDRGHAARAASHFGVDTGKPIGRPRDPLGLLRRAWWRLPSQRTPPAVAPTGGSSSVSPWMVAALVLPFVLRFGGYVLSLIS